MMKKETSTSMNKKISLSDKEIEYLCTCAFWEYMRAKIDLDCMDLLKQCNYKLPSDRLLKKKKKFYENLYRKLGGKGINDDND